MSNDLKNKINIIKVKNSKINELDFNNLNFGMNFTDHMVICDFKDGKWEVPKITPYQPITLNPSSCLIY